MKFKYLIPLLIFSSTFTTATNKSSKMIKIAVIDTGLDLTDPRFERHLCKTGHKNFVEDETINDYDSHGTHIAGIVQQYAENSNYCMLIYKYYKHYSETNGKREIMAIQEAINNNADVVNFSGGGSSFSEEEYTLIKFHPETIFVVAAGNDGKNLDIPGNEYYPASLFLPNERVVSSIDTNGVKSETSSWSKNSYWEVGQNVVSYIPNGKRGRMSGTSMSTAKFSGNLVAKMSKIYENRK